MTEDQHNGAKLRILLENEHGSVDLYRTHSFGTLHTDEHFATVHYLQEGMLELAVSKTHGPEWSQGHAGYVYEEIPGRWRAVWHSDYGTESAGNHESLIDACKALTL